MSFKKIQRTSMIAGTAAIALTVAALSGVPAAQALITTQLDFGATGSNVTQLQTYLATDTTIYPEGRITGYFGNLTQTSVKRFQVAQGISSSGTPATTGYGRVGPQTLVRLNTLIAGGGVVQTTIDTVPVLSAPVVFPNSTSVTITWTTNEPTRGQVYYDTTPLRTDEQSSMFEIPYVSGNLASDGGLQAGHVVTIGNLQPNTVYYYVTRGIDSGGNLSMTTTNTFRTNP